LALEQNFRYREGIKAHAEMGYAIIVISLEAKKICYPIKRHTFKSIVPANRVKDNEECHKKVG